MTDVHQKEREAGYRVVREIRTRPVEWIESRHGGVYRTADAVCEELNRLHTRLTDMEAENERLRGALERIADQPHFHNGGNCVRDPAKDTMGKCAMIDIARAALAPQTNPQEEPTDG